jgi:hypothetical protein
VTLGFRILQKHIKRQIISLNGGFQVIADLNTYYDFISSLKVRVFFDICSSWFCLFIFWVKGPIDCE